MKKYEAGWSKAMNRIRVKALRRRGLDEDGKPFVLGKSRRCARNMTYKSLEHLCFTLPPKKLNGNLPVGYEMTENESSKQIFLKVGKGTMFCGRPMHHTYWHFLGWKDGDVVHFNEWDRTDEMAPGWGGPATAGFGIMLDDDESELSVFDEKYHETDWEIAWEQLPFIVEEIKEVSNAT